MDNIHGTSSTDDTQHHQSHDSKGNGDESPLKQLWNNLTKRGGSRGSGSPVGALGVVTTTLFLIVLTVFLLYGITTQWPVCDLQDEPPAANDNRPAAQPGNANSQVTPPDNANTAANRNANANTNANAGASPNINASVSGRSPSPTPAPASNENPTRLDADSLEPASGPINGKTMVTIKGKNFGSSRENIVVRFGERDGKINQVTDKHLSVSTPRHSEGLVDVTVTKGEESDVLSAAYTYTCPPPSGSGLFIMLVMAGALGGCVHALRSLYWYSGQGELKWRWMPMYFALPFLGGAMAMLFSLLIIAGLVDQTSGRSQALFIIAIAGLVGMFSQQAALKLTDVANAFFTKPGEGKDSKPQESLSVGQTHARPFPLAATSISPSEGLAAGGEEVKITGTGFNTSTTVIFGSVAGRIKRIDATSITVATPPGTGEVDVVVKSGDQSVKLPGKFKYT